MLKPGHQRANHPTQKVLLFLLPRKLRRHCSEDYSEALPQTKVAVSLRRDDSRIAADLNQRLKALMDHKVIGNSAFFSAEREGYFGRIPGT